MRLRFWKLEGAGNDFVLVRDRPGLALAKLARALCDRRRGIGADGLLAVAAAAGRVRLRYANRDGSSAFCGNGARCAAWWAFTRGLAGRRLSLAAGPRTLAVRIAGPGRVEVAMPEPEGWRPDLRLRAGGAELVAHFIRAGVPHAVVPVRGLDRFPVLEAGRAIRRHRLFAPEGTNVDFVARDGAGLRLRTYERGVEDETWACGTGAVAAAAAAWRLGWTRPPVRVRARGGELTVRHGAPGAGGGFSLEGPARVVFSGEVSL
ncbi:MAG: diaminopimelate epimerase [Elusimicrobia bacterium]|nr:diaminopimelate epimerase [Elusimicrobiota bacterium]